MSNNYFNSTGTIGFTCDVCGRELQSCTWINGMSFCAKCYQDTFGNTLTTQQLLDFIKNSGWDIGGLSNVVRLDKEAHNMELQEKIKVLEKALERCYEYHKKHSTPADWIYHISKEEYIKEMMKSE